MLFLSTSEHGIENEMVKRPKTQMYISRGLKAPEQNVGGGELPHPLYNDVKMDSWQRPWYYLNTLHNKFWVVLKSHSLQLWLITKSPLPFQVKTCISNL